MKIVTIIGARPQFIKAAAVSKAINQYEGDDGQGITEIIVHTGQHYDKNMSEVFFNELNIPEPNYHLNIASLSHGAMTGRMLESIETVLNKELPDLVLIYGDTNSTLAGAIAASKIHIPVAHVEAGLRSNNMRMPEEINRILADRVSNLLLCPTESAVQNLQNEGVVNNVHLVGDVMYDATLLYRDNAKNVIPLSKWGVTNGKYALCTIHRAENTDDTSRLESILSALREISADLDVVLPLHPRTRILLDNMGETSWLDGLTVLEPVSYTEMLRLEMSAKVIITDSGGVQKEAYFNEVPCITMRDETEWLETVELGWNQIVGADRDKILSAYHQLSSKVTQRGKQPYGDGHASEKIVEIIVNFLSSIE